MAELWNGKRWRVLATPSVRGAQCTGLAAVTCSSATDCLAVGSWSTQIKSRFISRGIVATWNGATWRLLHLTTPLGSSFLGLSCVGGVCMIVGSLVTRSGETRLMAVQLQGNRLRVLKPVMATRAKIALFRDVACLSPSSCQAVGLVGPGPGGGSNTDLVETWNGVKWAVSCATGSSCVGVGATGSQGAEVWNGTKLRFVTTPAQVGMLFSVSCVTAQRCLAVGARSTGTGTTEAGTAALWNGKTWKLLPVSGK